MTYAALRLLCVCVCVDEVVHLCMSACLFVSKLFSVSVLSMHSFCAVFCGNARRPCGSFDLFARCILCTLLSATVPSGLHRLLWFYVRFVMLTRGSVWCRDCGGAFAR